MFFAAKEEYEQRKRERLRQEEARAKESGRQAGIQQERERVTKLLAEYDVSLPPEVARRLVGDKEIGRQEGIREERQRIGKLLAEYGDSVPPEIARSLAGDTD